MTPALLWATLTSTSWSSSWPLSITLACTAWLTNDWIPTDAAISCHSTKASSSDVHPSVCRWKKCSTIHNYMESSQCGLEIHVLALLALFVNKTYPCIQLQLLTTAHCFDNYAQCLHLPLSSQQNRCKLLWHQLSYQKGAHAHFWGHPDFHSLWLLLQEWTVGKGGIKVGSCMVIKINSDGKVKMGS